MSAQSEKALEFKVGLFVFIGLLFIAAMAFKFGRIGQGFQKYYDLTVEFPNASGLIKNSDVQLAGARIGYVAEKPAIAASAGSVTVPLKIIDGIKVPRQTKFQVGSSGLLGDRFVEVILEPAFDPAKFNRDDPAQVWTPGEKVAGAQAAGLEALQKKGEQVFDEIKALSVELRATVGKLNEGVLSDANQQNLSATMANLKTTSANFGEASKNLNAVVQNAQGVIDSTKQTMATVNSAAADLRGGIGDARKVLEAARGVMTKAQTGDGLLPTLLNNKQLSENFKALVVNLRERGVLFYKDRPGRAVETRERSAP